MPKGIKSYGEIGQRFGKLILMKILYKKRRNFWLCQCDCHNRIIKKYSELKSGNTKSCGCIIINRHKRENGERFGKLVTIKVIYKKNGNYWLCQCDCGNRHIVKYSYLKNNNTKSCGCYMVDEMKKRLGIKHPGYGKKWSIEQRKKFIKTRKGTNTGKDNVRWNPNLSDEERRKRGKTTKDSWWYKTVKEKDDYTCQCCGLRSTKGIRLILNSHHLNGKKDYPKLKHKLYNGITLCET